MAKVTGPLGSFSASGKLANSLVYFGHLGRNVVRRLVIPANPKSSGQGDVRQILGGLGRTTRVVVDPSDWLTDYKTLVPAGQTWVSYLVRRIRQDHMADVTAYESLATELGAHTASAEFESRAATAGLSDFTIAYSGTLDDFTAGLQLYAAAKHTMAVASANPSLFSRTPYTTDLASWTSAEVQAFIDDMQSVA